MKLLYCETLTGLKKPPCKYRLNMVSLWKHSCPSHYKYCYCTFQWVPFYLWNSLQLSQILLLCFWNTVLSESSALFLLLNTVVYLYNSAALSLNYCLIPQTYCCSISDLLLLSWNWFCLGTALRKYLILNRFTLKYCTSISEILLICHIISLFPYFFLPHYKR